MKEKKKIDALVTCSKTDERLLVKLSTYVQLVAINFKGAIVPLSLCFHKKNHNVHIMICPFRWICRCLFVCFIYLVHKHSYQGLVRDLDGNEIEICNKYIDIKVIR